MKLLTLVIFFISATSFSESIHYLYYKNIYGHLHQSSSSYSSSINTLSCGDKVKLIQDKKTIVTEFSKYSWTKVKFGLKTGFIRSDFLVRKLPNCFQTKYIKFFNRFELGLQDIYAWGKLYDQYVSGKAKVR